MKVYIKKGLKNYKENRLVKKIEEVVAKKIEQNPEFAVQAEAIAGRKNIPVIQFADGKFLVEPTDAELHAELTVRGLLK